MKTNLRIEIVSSTIPGLSSMSQRSRLATQALLCLHYKHVHITLVDSMADLEALVSRSPDLVFLGMKFLPVHPLLGAKDPAKIWISEYLDQFDIAYTGSDRFAHEHEQHKPSAKACIRSAGLNTSPSMVVKKDMLFSPRDINLPFPLFVKPTDSGGGTGVDEKSLVQNFDELYTKVMSISADYRTDSLVEVYLPGREFSVAILADEFTDELLVMPIELKAVVNAHGDSVLSQAVKSSNAEEVHEVRNGVVRDNVIALALGAYRALGARDYGRIDIRLDSHDVPHFLEANLIPSLIEGYGSFPKACHINARMNHESMILRIVNLALQRRTVSVNLSRTIVHTVPNVVV
ncbi:MAG: hypothetical protein ABIP74_05285 [Candidatus Saccharimonas sp.]